MLIVKIPNYTVPWPKYVYIVRLMKNNVLWLKYYCTTRYSGPFGINHDSRGQYMDNNYYYDKNVFGIGAISVRNNTTIVVHASENDHWLSPKQLIEKYKKC